MADGVNRVVDLTSGSATYHHDGGKVWESSTMQAASRKAALLNCGDTGRLTVEQIDAAADRLNLRPNTVEALRLVAAGHTWRSASSTTGVTQSGMLRAMRRIAVHLRG